MDPGGAYLRGGREGEKGWEREEEVLVARPPTAEGGAREGFKGIARSAGARSGERREMGAGRDDLLDHLGGIVWVTWLKCL